MEIELINVKKTIDKVDIINDVNLRLKSGNIYGFIGRNGSGKTMVLKMICGFVKPTEGTILIENKNIFAKNYFNGSIRALIEKPKFLGELTGYENLKLLADINKKIDSKEIEKWLKKFDMYKEKDKKYSKYSLGMKQKIGIIQVLMEEPNIIILDEPFNGLDENSTKLVKELLLKEKKKNKIIIIASHIKEDIDYLCDIKIKFEDGTIKSN